LAIAQLEKQYQQDNPHRKLIFSHCGKGIASKKQINVSVYSAEPGSGIQFIVPDTREDKGHPVKIPALAPYVVNTLRNVVLGQGSARVCLVEHFLAAAAFCNTFDIDVIVNGPELPIGDGSSEFWLELFSQSGCVPVLPQKKYILAEPVIVTKTNRWLIALPAATFSITYLMDWHHPSIGKRWCSWTSDQSPLDLARARTFGWKKDHDLLGLTDEVVSLTHDGFNQPLHFEDEPVRHKLLDLLGDLTLSGINPLAIQAQFISVKGGHEMDVELVKQLKDKIICI
jgi:UDP-3-O-[3-hydroxymyristoyl] N-acetylglucosamine deacetylase